MSAQLSVAAVLHEHAATYSNRPALIYAADAVNPTSDVSLSYRELDRAAQRVAVWLRERMSAGDRALLLYPPGVGFGIAFAGCLYADVIAVPVPVPTGPPQRDQLAQRVARDAGVAAVLTESATLAAVAAWRDAAGLTGVACVATDAIEPTDAEWTVPDVAPTAPMMLQYTSGSTSDPKGVVICHDNVLAQVAMSRRWMAVGEGTRFGGWLPMHHDMGLIVQLLQPLVLGATSVFTSPFEFLKRPVRWLQLLDRFRVEVSLAPHFAYEVSARQITDAQVATLDLRSWDVAGVGAEAVRAKTLRAFAERFAPAGFRPEALTIGYGLAEGTVYVAVGPRTTAPIVLSLDAERLERNEFVPVSSPTASTIVSCGVPCEMEILIVDPVTSAPLPDGQVGEVWVRGAGVARGYWGAEKATAETFGGTLVTGETGYLRTGDLGAMHDGELYITGRLKDLLIVRGRNLHPQDIEYEVRALDSALNARNGAVFAVPGHDAHEHIVIVQECAADLANDHGRLGGIVTVIRDWLARELGFRAAAVALVRPGGVSRTPSGKVQRTLMRELFMTASLDVMYEDLDPDLGRQYRKDAEYERNGGSANARSTTRVVKSPGGRVPGAAR